MGESEVTATEALTATRMREAIDKLKKMDAYASFVMGTAAYGMINPLTRGEIGNLWGVRFQETVVRTQFIDELEKEIQAEIKRKIK